MYFESKKQLLINSLTRYKNELFFLTVPLVFDHDHWIF